jgi:GxxExxY protein
VAFKGKHHQLTKKIIGAFFEVYKELGYGFSEKVYENAFLFALKGKGLQAEAQTPVQVYFQGQIVGIYIVDILVENKVILELKAVQQISDIHEAQLLNYLKATEIEVGLLFNFGPEGTFKRKIYDNVKKGSLSWVEDKQYHR